MIKDTSFKMRMYKEEKEIYEKEVGKLELTLAGVERMCIMREINSTKEGNN